MKNMSALDAWWTSFSGFMQKEQRKLEPIIKWPGGKEKELEYIIPNLPSGFVNFYEPFVGGGSVFMGIESDNYFINDFSSELIDFYHCIQNEDKHFFDYCENINKSLDNAKQFAIKNFEYLSRLYYQYKLNELSHASLIDKIDEFIDNKNTQIISILDGIIINQEFFIDELSKTLKRKMQRMAVLENQKGAMPSNDIYDNIETVIKGSLYMYYRHIYNSKMELNKHLKTSLFFFLRNYAYSGMFRYNSNGEFNVPYGGIAYNSKLTRNKLLFYQSGNCKKKFAKTIIENMDFEQFLIKYQPNEQDFIFLDPPYDTEFSTYAQNAFSRNDQKRLANYLINTCRAKWMLIIKNTDFIYDLYANHNGVNISAFDKKYTVSFMNRNEKNVTHLLIKNYV